MFPVLDYKLNESYLADVLEVGNNKKIIYVHRDDYATPHHRRHRTKELIKLMYEDQENEY